MASDLILTESGDGVMKITLNRPEVRNAMNSLLVDQLLESLQWASNDRSVGAIILTGADPVFCSGADLKEMAATSAEEMWQRVDKSMRLYSMIAEIRKPVVAAVNGHALAGGCGLAMACDIVIASVDAEFGYPEVQRGLVAALVMVSLGRLVGRRNALEILLTGRRVPAVEARELGMVNEVVESQQVQGRAFEIAKSLADLDREAVGLTKDLFYRAAELPVAAAMDRARLVNLMVRYSRATQSGDAPG
jgi:methylglutaconyl-CoA hydratase